MERLGPKENVMSGEKNETLLHGIEQNSILFSAQYPIMVKGKQIQT